MLRLEIGGSENYILSCVNSSAEIPIPGETLPATEDTVPANESGTEAVEELDPTADPTEGTAPDQTEPAFEDDGTVAGIPIAHIALFGGGMVIAVGGLIGIHFYQKKRESNRTDEDDENDEI